MSTTGVKKNLRGATTYAPPHSEAYRNNYDRIFGKKEGDDERTAEASETGGEAVAQGASRGETDDRGHSAAPAKAAGEDFPSWQGAELRTIGQLMVALDRLASCDEAGELMAILRRHSPHANSNVGYVAGCFVPEKATRIMAWCGVAFPADEKPDTLDMDTVMTALAPIIPRAGASCRA